MSRHSKTDPQIRHFRAHDGIALTVAVMPFYIMNDKRYLVGMSLCHRHDNGSKNDGTIYALGRLNTGVRLINRHIVGDVTTEWAKKLLDLKTPLPEPLYVDKGIIVLDAKHNNDTIRGFIRGLRRTEAYFGNHKAWNIYRKTFYGEPAWKRALAR